MQKKKTKEDLLAEVIGAGSGHVPESAIESSQGRKTAKRLAAKTAGRPAKEPTVQFTLKLRPGAAQLLQELQSELQGRAIRGEIPRSEATISLIVEESLHLYAKKHHHKSA